MTFNVILKDGSIYIITINTMSKIAHADYYARNSKI